ncbi:hypothetical protein Sjap_006264 [Stephania japonica]|uniref:Ubiquitin-like domain-containing protein n=1 Tax=Stephania japonica TaxID=461633 RepID=A0AAP0K5P8_9MAGN
MGYMNIYLRVRKTIAVRVKNSCTVQDLKTKYQDVEDIPERHQLFFVGKQLEVGSTKLAQYGIKNGSTVDIFDQSQAPIKIYIKRTQDIERISLDVSKSDSIHDVKARIQFMEGSPTNDFAIVYGGKHLEDSKTLSDYSIQSGSTLYLLDIKKIFVFLPTGEKIELEVQRWHTVENVKAMVESMAEVQTKEQILTLDGRHLEDGRKLSEYNINKGSKLHLIQGMEMVVLTNEGNIVVTMGSSDTVGHMKEKILEKKGIPVYDQILLFNMEQLDDAETLSYYGIDRGSELLLVINTTMQIFVRSPRGNTLSFFVQRADTIKDLKLQIEEKEKIPFGKLKLIYEGKLLKDVYTLAECNIQKESNLHLHVYF